MPSIRSSILLGLLALVFGCFALAGALPIGPQHAVAADETGEETTTEEPPVVETPTEPETTPEPETPANPAPPVTTPPVGAPPAGEGGGTPVETPKSTPSTGSEASGGGSVGAGGGGGGGSSSGSSGSNPTSAATTSPGTAPSRHTARDPSHAAGGGGGGSAGGNGGDRGSKVGTGGGDSRDTGGGGHRAPSHSGGGASPQPTVSPQGIDEGASAVSNVAAHVGEVFAEALPTAPLKKIGDRLAAHIAGANSVQSGKERKQAVDGIGTALGAALIGSAVAVDRAPAANSSPIPFFDPPGGKSGTIYLILIAALLLAVGALVFREARSSLGFGTPRARVRVSGAKSRIELRQRAAVALLGVRRAADRWSWRFRRLRSNAVAGLRSLF